MTSEEIRKLLGGYATNTLSDTQRKVLFDAALEDQELFNALQDDQALKELLHDPVSRAHVHQALREPVQAWWKRWWAWSGALSAVAATGLMVAIIHSNSPPTAETLTAAKAPAVQTPPATIEREKSKAVEEKPRPEADRGFAVRARRASSRPADTAMERAQESAPLSVSNRRKDEIAPASPPPANSVVDAITRPAAPQSMAQQSQVNGMPGGPSQNAILNQNQVSQNQAAQAASSFRAATSGALAEDAKGPLSLRYSLVKREAGGAYLQVPAGAELKTGDAIRLSVVASLPGYLVLERLETSGGWKRVFPLSGPGLPVAANTSYSIPDTSITVADQDQQLRLLLNPFGGLAEADLEKRQSAKEASKKTTMRSEAQLTAGRIPVIVNLRIGPRKLP